MPIHCQIPAKPGGPGRIGGFRNLPRPSACAGNGGNGAADHALSQTSIRERQPVAIQRKLAVGESNTTQEREAEDAANQIARQKSWGAARNAAPAGNPPPEALPRLRSAAADTRLPGAPDVVREVLRSPGERLEPELLQNMSARFGHDFARVRVHSGPLADRSAAAVNAKAYTVGPSIVFGRGQFAPQTSAGQRLLAHELAHVVQQSGAAGSDGMLQRSPSEGSDLSSRPAPTPKVVAENPLVDAMAQFAAIRPSNTASGIYEGEINGRRVSLNAAKFNELKLRVQEAAENALRRASSRTESAIDRYQEQQKVDAHHWMVAPIVKALGGVRDPGPRLVEYVETARLNIKEAKNALKAGDYVSAARLIGDGEGKAEQASVMVLAYVDQIIGTSEMTVTVLEGVKTASAVILFLCAVAATGGTLGAGATALGLEGVGATTTLAGVTASTATWATAVGTTAAIASEVGVGIVRAADGDKVDWGEIAVHAAIQIVIARFSPAVGQQLSNRLGSVAAASPAVRQAIAQVGMARVVTIATNVLMHEGSQIFATAVEDTVRALRGKPITWSQFGEHLYARLTDPKGLLMATLAGMLGGTHPEANRENPRGQNGSANPIPKSKTDNADWRSVNRDLGLPSPRAKPTPAPKAPPGHQDTTAEQAFRPTPVERTAAINAEVAQKGPPLTSRGTPIQQSTTASSKGPQFQAASMTKPSAFAKTIRADAGEAQAYQEALKAGEIGLESPQGTNVGGRADFVTAGRDATGKMWIIANDAKTYSGEFPAPQPGLRPGWNAQVKAAVDRASVGHPGLKAELTSAFEAGRIWVRQVNVSLPASGTVSTSGITPPSPVPWGPLLGPRDFEDKDKKTSP
jgi:Domain of unknown function (DUF4157)